jgi:DNA-binding MarR family transcriptional regulator
MEESVCTQSADCLTKELTRLVMAHTDDYAHSENDMNSDRNRSLEVLFTLRKIIRSLDMHSRYLAKHIGLTSPQLVVLYEISLFERITVGELAKQVSLSQATVTSIIDRLEPKQLVTRERSGEDRRKVYLKVGPAARKVLHDRPSMLHRGFVRKFEALAEWEQHHILSAVQRVADMMHDADLERPWLADEITAPLGHDAHETSS